MTVEFPQQFASIARELCQTKCDAAGKTTPRKWQQREQVIGTELCLPTSTLRGGAGTGLLGIVAPNCDVTSNQRRSALVHNGRENPIKSSSANVRPEPTLTSAEDNLKSTATMTEEDAVVAFPVFRTNDEDSDWVLVA